MIKYDKQKINIKNKIDKKIILIPDVKIKIDHVNKINKVFNDDLQIKKISKNAKNTVLENYKLEVLYKFINQICS